MEIKITNGHKFTLQEEQDIENAQLQAARAASSFSLRLTEEGKLDKYAFSQLLAAARASNAYQANQQHYQFKLKSDSNGHYLTLKQQGLWSRFKGVFAWGRETRERQRADAKRLIEGMSVFEINQARQQGRITGGTSFSQAKADQVAIMNTMEPTRHRQARSQSSSEEYDFEKLMGDTFVQQSEGQVERITQQLIHDEQIHGNQPHSPLLNAQRSPAEQFANRSSQSQDNQSDYGQIGQQQNSFIVAQNDDDESEGLQSSHKAGLFQQYLHTSYDENPEQHDVSDQARPSRDRQYLARLTQE
jgi:hypothetical protein